jgi:putative addiction module component (TIGR02574 family)
MSYTLDLRQLRRISIEERLEMMRQIWETIVDEEDTVETSPEVLEELKRRLADFEANPNQGSPWEEVEARLRRRLKSMRSPSRRPRKEISRKPANGTKSSKNS